MAMWKVFEPLQTRLILSFFFGDREPKSITWDPRCCPGLLSAYLWRWTCFWVKTSLDVWQGWLACMLGLNWLWVSLNNKISFSLIEWLFDPSQHIWLSSFIVHLSLKTQLNHSGPKRLSRTGTNLVYYMMSPQPWSQCTRFENVNVPCLKLQTSHANVAQTVIASHDGFELHRLSIKGTQPLMNVTQAIIIISLKYKHLKYNLSWNAVWLTSHWGPRPLSPWLPCLKILCMVASIQFKSVPLLVSCCISYILTVQTSTYSLPHPDHGFSF